VDLEEGSALINSYVQGRAWKVARASGEILWTLGEGGDFAADPDAADPWFAYAHSVDPIGDGHLLVYDNGSSARHASRVLEYALDDQSMEARIVWEYPGTLAEDSWYVISGGDVDLLDNGNRLVVADQRIMELTLEGEIVWQTTWVDDEDTVDLRSYQAERIPSLVERL